MTERLSDEQVANVLALGTGWVVADDAVKALALEVQQARQRIAQLEARVDDLEMSLQAAIMGDDL